MGRPSRGRNRFGKRLNPGGRVPRLGVPVSVVAGAAGFFLQIDEPVAVGVGEEEHRRGAVEVDDLIVVQFRARLAKPRVATPRCQCAARSRALRCRTPVPDPDRPPGSTRSGLWSSSSCPVRPAAARELIAPAEEDFDFGKDCFGLDQRQVRLYPAIARHRAGHRRPGRLRRHRRPAAPLYKGPFPRSGLSPWAGIFLCGRLGRRGCGWCGAGVVCAGYGSGHGVGGAVPAGGAGCRRWYR